MESDKSDKISGFSTEITLKEAYSRSTATALIKPERESTRQAKQRFIAIFEKVGGNITLVALKARVSRDTYYRWLREDVNFRFQLQDKTDYINWCLDDVLLAKALEGHFPSLKFWLIHNHPKYK